MKGDLREIDLFHIDALLRLAGQGKGMAESQAPGIDVFRSFEWLRFAKPRTESRSERDYRVSLRCLAGRRFQVNPRQSMSKLLKIRNTPIGPRGII